MTHPGEPGYASASRKAHTASVAEVAADDTADGLDALEPMGLDAVYATDDGERDATRCPVAPSPVDPAASASRHRRWRSSWP